MQTIYLVPGSTPEETKDNIAALEALKAAGFEVVIGKRKKRRRA